MQINEAKTSMSFGETASPRPSTKLSLPAGATYLIRNRVTRAEDIVGFDFAGYRFSAEESTEDAPVFLRQERLAKAS